MACNGCALLPFREPLAAIFVGWRGSLCDAMGGGFHGVPRFSGH